jgi:hypothetical protein
VEDAVSALRLSARAGARSLLPHVVVQALLGATTLMPASDTSRCGVLAGQMERLTKSRCGVLRGKNIYATEI